jgi:hypothetical protein
VVVIAQALEGQHALAIAERHRGGLGERAQVGYGPLGRLAGQAPA